MRNPSHGRAGTSTSASSRRSALLSTAALRGAAVLPIGAASRAEAAPMRGSQGRPLGSRERVGARAVPHSCGPRGRRRGQQDARGTYDVPKQHAASLPDAQTRHYLSRFTSAVTAGRLADVAAAGGMRLVR